MMFTAPPDPRPDTERAAPEQSRRIQGERPPRLVKEAVTEEILRCYRSCFLMQDTMLAATQHLNSRQRLTIHQRR